jgi:hypothetical protein
MYLVVHVAMEAVPVVEEVLLGQELRVMTSSVNASSYIHACGH